MPGYALRARGSIVTAFLILLSLSGCASLPSFGFATSSGKEKAAPASAVPPPASASKPEPQGLLAFVTAASPGQSRIFEDGVKGAVRVTMGRQYHSAGAVVCRHFTLAFLALGAANGSETRAVCREPQGWRIDPIGSIGASARVH